MAIDFPNSPTTNQTYTVGATTWKYDGEKWVVTASGRTGPSAVTVSDTAPTSPSYGSFWYNSSNGRTYTYYADANSSQWVEVGSADPTFSTLTTKGDILTRSSSAMTRLGVGTNNQVLVADSTQTTGMAWASLSAFGSEWTSYTPTVSSQTGTITTVSAGARYIQIQKLVIFRFQVSITNKGTGGGALYLTLPVTAHSSYVSGMSGAVGTFSEWTSIGFIGTTNILQSNTQLGLLKYDWTTPIVNGTISGFATYEAA